MNAIVALCHFCEQHGPVAVFCTQVVRGNLKDCLTDPPPPANDTRNCASCLSIGSNLVFLTKDDNLQLVSTQSPLLSSAIVAQVKHSAFRSLSCDIYPNRESGFVFFGDSTKGHVLSHAFELQDESARGQRKLYSIIVLMKDKLFLLNIEPFLSEAMTKISKELQEQASSVFQEENRGRARSSGVVPPARSLAELTGEKHVFAHLHSHFCWILWGGARYLSEEVTIGTPIAPPWLGHETEEGFTMIQVDKEEWLMRRQFGTGDDDPELSFVGEEIEVLRQVFDRYRPGFTVAAFCLLTGIPLVIRGDLDWCRLLARGFTKLLPDSFDHHFDLNANKFTAEKKLLFLPSVSAVPPCSPKLCIMECLVGTVATKWGGDLPSKLPEMLQKTLKFFEEKMFNIETLEQRLKVLVHEWKNKVICLKQIKSSGDVSKMKKVLGIQPQDSALISYWTNNL